MVLAAVDVLDRFAQELHSIKPSEIPRNIESTRGWTIRFEALEEYCQNVPTDSLQSLVRLLDRPIKVLTSYIRRWGQHVSGIDPLLRTYEIMPGEEDVIDSVRVLLDRAIHVQKAAVSELGLRS